MNQRIVIRNETHNDVCAITEVTIAAFKTLEISNHTEQFIVEAPSLTRGKLARSFERRSAFEI